MHYSHLLAFVSKIGGVRISSKLLSQAQVRGTKGNAVLPGPRTSNKVLSLDLLNLKHLKSGRDSMFFQELPQTTRNPLMQ